MKRAYIISPRAASPYVCASSAERAAVQGGTESAPARAPNSRNTLAVVDRPSKTPSPANRSLSCPPFSAPSTAAPAIQAFALFLLFFPLLPPPPRPLPREKRKAAKRFRAGIYAYERNEAAIKLHEVQFVAVRAGQLVHALGRFFQARGINPPWMGVCENPLKITEASNVSWRSARCEFPRDLRRPRFIYDLSEIGGKRGAGNCGFTAFFLWWEFEDGPWRNFNRRTLEKSTGECFDNWRCFFFSRIAGKLYTRENVRIKRKV